MRALSVVNCQSALVWFLLRSACQAAISSASVRMFGMRRSRHWDDKTLSSISAIQPTAVLGRKMPFEPFDQPARLGWRKSLIKRRRLMGAEIVLHQHDLAGCRKVVVGQSLEYLCIVQSGAAVGDLDVSPSLQWCEQHEQIGGAVALILVVVAGGLSRLGRDWHARFLDKLFGCFIQADQGAVRIARPLVDLQHILCRIASS